MKEATYTEGHLDGAWLWALKAERGFPLDMAIQQLGQANKFPTWDKLFDAADKDGADIEKLSRELQFYVREAYPPTIAEQVNTRLALLAQRY